MSSSVNFLADKQGLNAVAPGEHTDPLPCRKEFTGQFLVGCSGYYDLLRSILY